ncbi:hypothetical protein [Sphingomonas sp.]|uniref:hypothetical protein n=1 Tax=Sphingomonas sp. TaxID=28214 RepID=UPI003BAAE6A0
MATSFDIEVPRQGDWLKEIQLTDAEGNPANLTGCTIEWSARATAGAGSVLASATTSLIDGNEGLFSARWHGPDFDGFGIVTQPVRVAHDLKVTYPDGTIEVPVRGQLIIYPEVTA